MMSMQMTCWKKVITFESLERGPCTALFEFNPRDSEREIEAHRGVLH